MIEFLFLDLDDTILDFHKAERTAISRTFSQLGLEPTQTLLERYHIINIAHWQMLERGELTREQVLVQRFAVLFEEFGKDADAALCAQLYHDHLSRVHDFLPGAWEAVQNLHRKYRLFLASNGTAHVQAQRLRDTGLQQYFEDIFISEELGADKPSREFFARSFARIPDFDPSRAMIVGDSLTSDILGGKNAGILTCWVNPQGKEAGICPDYEIASLSELEALLESL